MDALTDRIDAVLPQTQCRQCGFAGCRPYAEAVAARRCDINRCPPGGSETVLLLANLTGRPVKPLEGLQKPPAVARIDEPVCIGCTLCIRACPVDAIAGAVNVMHTVIAAECSGCELCLPVCPVDCIAMIDAGTGPEPIDSRERAQHYKQRFIAREKRLERERKERAAVSAAGVAEQQKRAAIARVMQRARQRLERRSRSGKS